jgi:hypothetical protein
VVRISLSSQPRAPDESTAPITSASTPITATFPAVHLPGGHKLRSRQRATGQREPQHCRSRERTSHQLRVDPLLREDRKVVLDSRRGLRPDPGRGVDAPPKRPQLSLALGSLQTRSSNPQLDHFLRRDHTPVLPNRPTAPRPFAQDRQVTLTAPSRDPRIPAPAPAAPDLHHAHPTGRSAQSHPRPKTDHPHPTTRPVYRPAGFTAAKRRSRVENRYESCPAVHPHRPTEAIGPRARSRVAPLLRPGHGSPHHAQVPSRLPTVEPGLRVLGDRCPATRACAPR